MPTYSEGNKIIAKNTILLYIRMIFTMVISLYTSRVILNTLGITDFGIYNVVGGVISLLGFVTSSLGGASSRYITFELGKGNTDNLKRIFGNILSIHILFSIAIFILGETIGLWFFYNKLQIPPERFNAAFWVYQFSIFTSILSFISIPYNAVIIAHEKMSAFAYISIIDVILKLLIVYLLLVIPYDKLIIYSILFFCIQAFDRIIYGVYCSKHFEETHTKLQIDKNLFKELFDFAFWTMGGNLACIGYTQGLNILLNIFFGPTINAARGIAVQVQSVVRNFCLNFQTAINPQITKNYAKKDLTQMHSLIQISSKYSFLLLYLISLPLILEAPIVLKWWLGIVPDHTINFLRIILCTSLVVSLSNPLVISIYATGEIKKFQIIEGSLLLCIVPIAYVCLKFSVVPPEIVFIIHLIIELITQVVRIKLVLPQIKMKEQIYYRQIIIPIFRVVIVSASISVLIYNHLQPNFFSFLLLCTICVISIITTTYFLGCNTNEREYIKNKLKLLYLKFKK